METNRYSGLSRNIKKVFAGFMRYRNGMLAFFEGLENHNPTADWGALQIIIGCIVMMVVVAVILGCVIVIQA
ncbi:MAG TPA: hypothetical protein VK623_03665 [Flavobacterium sp.]|nr:hypothetical protein [Flavobacterium sp.]